MLKGLEVKGHESSTKFMGRQEAGMGLQVRDQLTACRSLSLRQAKTALSVSEASRGPVGVPFGAGLWAVFFPFFVLHFGFFLGLSLWEKSILSPLAIKCF